MASERNRILRLKKFIESRGISVNLAKNKARGNRGVFIQKKNVYRIDVAKDLTEFEELSVLVHEYAHFLHYTYDKDLKNLNFIFGDYNEDLEEELRKVTVHDISKKFATDILSRKEFLKGDINSLASNLKNKYPNFLLSKVCEQIEKNIKVPYKYLLSYDRIKYFGRVYSVSDVNKYSENLNESMIDYIKLRSKQREIKRINNKIKNINNYYNKPTELFARFMEYFFTNPKLVAKLAPNAYAKMENKIKSNNIKELTNFYNLYFENLNI